LHGFILIEKSGMIIDEVDNQEVRGESKTFHTIHASFGDGLHASL